MTKSPDPEPEKARATADTAADRPCLRCRATFRSEGFGERICPRCKGSVAWRSAVSVGGGQGRRRSDGSAS